MAKINGTNLVVYVNTGSGGLEACSFSQDCKLSVDMGTANATTKDSAGWDEIIATNGKWTMDTTGLVDFHPSGAHNVADLFTALTAKATVTVAFSLTSPTTGDKSWSGSAYITKLEENAKDKDVVSYSVTFQGTGALTMATS
jgi:predicted secreted protein